MSKTLTTGADWFVERAQASGLDFVHVNGMSGRFYYPEIMAPGVALLDYDNDGDLDVYVTQGQMLGPVVSAEPPSGKKPLKDRLFRNDLVVSNYAIEASETPGRTSRRVPRGFLASK